MYQLGTEPCTGMISPKLYVDYTAIQTSDRYSNDVLIWQCETGMAVEKQTKHHYNYYFTQIPVLKRISKHATLNFIASMAVQCWSKAKIAKQQVRNQNFC